MGRILSASRRYQLRRTGRLAEAYTDVRLRISACIDVSSIFPKPPNGQNNVNTNGSVSNSYYIIELYGLCYSFVQHIERQLPDFKNNIIIQIFRRCSLAKS